MKLLCISHNLILAALPQSGSSARQTILLILLLLLCLLSAITAGAQTAFFSLRAKDVNELISKDSGAARRALKLLEQPALLSSNLSIANVMFNVVFAVGVHLLVQKSFTAMPVPLSLFVQFIIIAAFLLLFAEVLPKVYAAQNSMSMVLFSAPVLVPVLRLMRPFTGVWTPGGRPDRQKQSGRKKRYNPDDLDETLKITGQATDAAELNVFKGILKFGNITAKQIMSARTDIVAIAEDMSFDEVRKIAVDKGFSRLPVYRAAPDSIVGMLYTKDLLPFVNNGSNRWQQLIRPAFFVHEGKAVEDLLREFQAKKMHFAIVVDEYGGTSGIVTLEDIMEEIIGDISDEFGKEKVYFKKIDENTFEFDGKMLIDDAERLAGLAEGEFDNVRGESDSVAGLLQEQAGKILNLDEQVRINACLFTVIEKDNMRIKKVLMRKESL